KGRGIISNKNKIGNLIFFMNSNPNTYNITPDITNKRDTADRKRIVHIIAMTFNRMPAIKSINPP
ncbi:MAG: hypothetical protein OIN88_15335, partial [Candidatus Methanoperedens sp.]|nr:hypothetical protein [Candidatus Methanoperedens sp.]